MDTLELNIDYHVKKLIIVATAKYKVKKDRAKALGITECKLNGYLKKYGLESCNYWDFKK